MKKKATISLLLLSLLFIINKAQAQTNYADSAKTVHPSLGIRVGGGIDFFILGKRHKNLFNDKQYTIQQFGGYSFSGGLQYTILGKRNISAMIEVNDLISSMDMIYTWTRAAGASDEEGGKGNYHININRVQCAFVPKYTFGKKRKFYVDCGIYYAKELYKTFTGTINGYSGTAFNGSYQNTFKYRNFLLDGVSQVGATYGCGYNYKLKNHQVVFLDLRIDNHFLSPVDNSYGFQLSEVYLSVGFTFFESKRSIILKKATPIKPKKK